MSAQFLKDKAREISYALIRVSFYVKRTNLRLKLEKSAFELLENSSVVSVDSGVENINKALVSISVLDGLVRLAHSIYEIEPVNANILIKELDNFNTAIRQYGNMSESGNELPNISGIFSRYPVAVSNATRNENNNSYGESEYANNGFNPLNSISSEGVNNNGNGVNAAMRQSAIIDKIRSGNDLFNEGGNDSASLPQVKLKDLMVGFPDISERTLRYDLKRLCEQGIIERVGNGGPASYYRLK